MTILDFIQVIIPRECPEVYIYTYKDLQQCYEIDKEYYRGSYNCIPYYLLNKKIIKIHSYSGNFGLAIEN